MILGFLFFIIAYLIRSLALKIFVNIELRRKDNNLLEAMNAKGLTPIVIMAIIQGNVVFANIVIGGIFSSVLVTSLLIFLIQGKKYSSSYELIRSIINRVKLVYWKIFKKFPKLYKVQ